MRASKELNLCGYLGGRKLSRVSRGIAPRELPKFVGVFIGISCNDIEGVDETWNVTPIAIHF